MPYLTGVLTGILLTVLVLFVVDNFGSGSDARPIVNGACSARSSAPRRKRCARRCIEATAPDGETSAPALRDEVMARASAL
jgi:hypothetical protein